MFWCLQSSTLIIVVDLFEFSVSGVHLYLHFHSGMFLAPKPYEKKQRKVNIFYFSIVTLDIFNIHRLQAVLNSVLQAGTIEEKQLSLDLHPDLFTFSYSER